jgi:hypothetical protein
MLFSCSKENSLLEYQQPKKYKNTNEVYDYLLNFYGDGYLFGDSVSTTDKNGITFIVKEVIVNGEARGYYASNQTGSVQYFADVDRSNYVLTIKDFQTNLEEEFTNINAHDDYASTDEFDFIKIIQDGESEQSEKRRFWGWSDWTYGPCNNGYQTATRTHYVFWLKNTHDAKIVPC